MTLETYFKQADTPTKNSSVGVLMVKVLAKNPHMGFEEARQEAHRLLDKAAGRAPGQAGTDLAYGAGGLGREGDHERAQKITEALLVDPEKERLARESQTKSGNNRSIPICASCGAERCVHLSNT